MVEPALDSWPSRVGRVVLRVPGESWSALAAVPEYVCNVSQAAAGMVRETAASEQWARFVEVPSNVVRHVNSAVWKTPGAGDGGSVSAASAAVAAQGSRLSVVGQESMSRLALMIGALVPLKPVLPGIAWGGTGRSRQARTRMEHVESYLPEPVVASSQERVQAGDAESKATRVSKASEGVNFLLRAGSRWRGDGEAQDDAQPDLEPLRKAAEAQDLRALETGCLLPEFVPYSAKVPWHSGPRAVFSVFFPRYGNYCGPNWSSGRSQGSLTWDKPPVDRLDYCCYCHDIGYDSHDQRDLYEADIKLLHCLEAIPERERWDKKNSRMSIAGAYRVLCIIGLRSFLMPYRRELIKRIEAAERNSQLFAPKREELQDSKHQ